MAVEKQGNAGPKNAGDSAEQLYEATTIVEGKTEQKPTAKSGGGSKGGKQGGDGGGSGGGKGKGGGGSPSGKNSEKKKSLVETWVHFIQFLREVVIEFKKVTWPDRGQVLRETWSVLFLVTVITLLVLAFDYALSHLFFTPVESWARMHGGGFGGGFGK